MGLSAKEIENSIGACGLVCALCGDRESGCQGCGARSGAGCTIIQCCRDKGLEGCFECGEYPCGDSPPGESMFGNLRVMALNHVAREEGRERLAQYLKRNHDNGIVYRRRNGLKGDYDLFSDRDKVVDFIRSGVTDRKPSL